MPSRPRSRAPPRRCSASRPCWRRSSARRWAAISRSSTTGAGSSTSTSRWAPWRLLVCYFVVDDPDYLKKERAELRRRPLNFDYIGLGLLALVMSCWEIMLSKGQEWDWLGDPFWRVQTLLILFVLGLGVPDLPGDADRQPGGQLPAAGRAQLGGLLHHHLLCLRRALRRQHVPAGPAPVPVWLRRLRLGTGAVALRRFLHHDAAGCRHPPRSGHSTPAG